MARTDEPTIEGVDTAEMSDYLAQTAVVFAILFGSYARGTAGDSSDVDVGLCFPDEMDEHERFRIRNRIDAQLQQYADTFVDVSDLARLPTPVTYAALQDGLVLVGDEQTVEAYREQVEQEYKATAADRERERREFIDRLARGDV